MKKSALIACTVILVMLLAAPVFAGSIKNETNPANGLEKCYYEYDDGSYLYLEWLWIDDDNDGIAECYFFGPDGYMQKNYIANDSYQTNEKGQWIVDGIVQTKPVSEISQADTTAGIQNAMEMPIGTYIYHSCYYSRYDSETNQMILTETEDESSPSASFEIKRVDENGLHMLFSNHLFGYYRDVLAKPAMSGAYMEIDIEDGFMNYFMYKLDPSNNTITTCAYMVSVDDPLDGGRGVANVYKLVE